MKLKIVGLMLMQLVNRFCLWDSDILLAFEASGILRA